MKRNSKILAFVVALAMVMSMMVMPATVNADWSYEAENLFAEITAASGKTVTATTVSALNGGGTTTWAYYNKTTGSTDHSVDLQSDGSVLISGRNDAEDGIRQTYARVYTGHTYLASARVKLAAGAAKQTNFEISVGKAGAIDGKTNWIDSVSGNGDAKTVYSDGWYYVYKQFTVNAVSDATAETHRENGAHIGFKLPGVTSGETTTFADYYIRDMKLVDVTDSLNLAHKNNADLESGTLTLTTDKNATAEVTTAAKHNGSYGVSLTGYTANTNTVRVTGIPKTNDVWYRASAWVKLANAESGSTKAYMQASENGAQCASCGEGAPNWSGDTVDLSATEWKLVYVDFKPQAYTCTVNEDGVCATSSATITRTSIHFGPRFKTADVPVYIDDFALEQFTPAAFTATLTNGTVDTDSAEINVSFSNAPVSFTEANVVAEGATVAVSGSGTSYTISLTDLTEETSYTIALKDVTDAYGQTATGTATVETEAIPEVVSPAPVTSFVDVAAAITQAGSRTSHLIEKVADGEWTVTKKAGTIQTGYTEDKMTTDNVQRTSLSIENGKKYVVTAMVKNLDETPDAKATAVVTAGESGDSAHNIDAVMVAEKISIASSDWVELVGIVTVSDGLECNCTTTTCTKQKSVAHFGVMTSAENTKFQVKDITVRELTTLAYDNSFGALTVDNGDGTASLYITNATATTVYFVAASYDQDGRLADVKFGSALADSNGGFIDIDVPENYKVMIWDSNLKPLHNTFLGSDF